MGKVILDTNFVIYCAKNKLDYVEEIRHLLNEDYELVVPKQVIQELKRLKVRTKKGKDKVASDLALKLLKHNQVKEVSVKGKSVDDGIINLSNENKKNIVATLDREMRGILGRVILISRGKKLIITK
ncbi:ribonuclease VapC [archaeon]|jgi:rRNA-processing protein FCF1|nr:ribonuclease VapC [archaeon]MBT4241972.1 ribonuclease VapC [archaeon]MBT4418519.1 ribonuclease VapC [archaeon]